MKSRLIPLLIAVVLMIAGCSGSGDDTDNPAAVSDSGSGEVPQANPLIRIISSGSVEGMNSMYDTWAWLGVPFARPPVGELRWRAPRNPEKWDGIRKTDKLCGMCIQYADTTPEGSDRPDVKGTEDCLYLNIWRPATDEADLPVFVYIHGGGNINGDASNNFLDGSRFSSKNKMVVVTVNYRLGYMGWFTLPAMREGGDALDDSGNYGTLDLIKSLEWVRENIKEFGGNPQNVTIAGQSAGGIDIFSLLASPLAEGLFHKAIAMSGFNQSATMETADRKGQTILKRLLKEDGLSVKSPDENGSRWTREYLRSKTPGELYGPAIAGMVQTESILTPLAIAGVYVDGTVIPMSPLKAVSTGKYNKVPIILGCTKDELRIFVSSAVIPKDKLPEIHSKYDPENPNLTEKDLLGNNYRAIMALSDVVVEIGHVFFQAYGVDTMAKYLSGNQKIYVYKFSWEAQPEPFDKIIGASHAVDVPFLFGNFDSVTDAIEGLSWSDANRESREYISDSMMRYYNAFARTGDPNSGNEGLPEWKPWSNEKGADKRLIYSSDRIYMSSEVMEPILFFDTQAVMDQIARLLYGL